jgi:orotate phosphoribosyltransferase
VKRTEEWWFDKFLEKGALWIHDGNPKRPHIVTSGGDHTGVYFNSPLVMADDELLRLACSDLVDLLPDDILTKVERVVGPRTTLTGEAKLAQFLSMEIEVRRGRMCQWSGATKVVQGSKKGMRFVLGSPYGSVYPEEYVLRCDDVITSGESLRLIGDAVVDGCGGSLLAGSVVLVNRSGSNNFEGQKVWGLMRHYTSPEPPEKCTFCRAGSRAIASPREKWEIFSAQY